MLQVTQPGRTVTRARPASASVSAPAGVDTLTWGTLALPPPWVTGLTALGPISAMLPITPGSSGSTGEAWAGRPRGPAPPASLRSSVNAIAATRRSNAGSASTGRLSGPILSGRYRPGIPSGAMPSGPMPSGDFPFAAAPFGPRAPTRRASRKIRRTLASTSSSLTSPARTAAVSRPPHGPDGPGMARSSPAVAVATVVRAACQSDRATPWKPHSCLRIADSSRGCSVMVMPLTML